MMSAIADFRLIEISKLGGLRDVAKPKGKLFGGVKDDFFTFLSKESVTLKKYTWSGYYFATLLVYLEEKGIDLMKSSFDELSTNLTNFRNSTFFIFTEDHKKSYQDSLEPSKYSESELKKYYEEFNEIEDEDAGKALIDGIKILQENFKSLEVSKVIVFGIY
jgi:hypothetical protein